MLDNNNAALAIAAGSNQLYQLHNDGSIFRFTGTPCSGGSCPGWQMLDNKNAAIAITAAARGLLQLHNDGSIWRFGSTPCTGSSCPGWQQLDRNPNAIGILASDAGFFQRRIPLKAGFLTGAKSTTRSTDVCRSLLPKRSI
jgi:ribosomal protein L24E